MGFLLALVLSLLGCGMPTTSPPGNNTALQAVRMALQTLHDRHPAGEVVLVGSDNVAANGTAERWIIHVWDPAQNATFHYQVASGRLSDVGSSGLAKPPTRPVVAHVDQAAIAPVLDSDAATDAGGAAGGTAFEQQTGASVLSMTLSGSVGEDLRWSIFYSKPYTGHQATLELDAKSGDLVALDTEDPAFHQPGR